MRAPVNEASPIEAPLLSRDARLFLASRFLSTIASQMQSVAIAWEVDHATRNPMSLALVGLAQFFPFAALALVAGDTADRFDRRRIVLIVQLMLILCSGLLFTLSWAGISSVVPVYGVLLLFGASRAFGGPAGQALLPSLVTKEQLSRVIAWNSSIWQIGTIAGPALGGLLYGIAGSGGHVYGASATLSLASFLLVSIMRVKSEPAPSVASSWERLTAGIAFVLRTRILLGALSLDLFAVLLGGSVALLPVYARDILQVGPYGLGVLRSAPAAGASAMAIFLARRPLGGNVGVKMLSCVGLFGLATIVFGISRNFGLSLAALFVLGAADIVSVVTRQTLVQLGTPPEMRGRVSAVNLVFIGASNELGEFESGVTARLLGTVPAVVVGGVGTLAVVALWARLFPELRRVDRIDGTEPQREQRKPTR